MDSSAASDLEMQEVEAEEAKNSDDSAENSSVDSSDGDDDNDEQNELIAAGLETKVHENPYDYNGHLELLKQLQLMNELERLRAARERMSQYFPLSPELWLAWLQDEQKVITSDEERNNVRKLFDRAVKDYLSVDVWLEYVQFIIGSMNSDGGIQLVRDTFERAVMACGLHVTKGMLLWEAYREFEMVVLSMIPQESETINKDLIDELKRVGTLFKRQLSCPLMNMQKTYDEFEEWLDAVSSSWASAIGKEDDSRPVDKAHVDVAYKKALEKLHKVQPFEDVLDSSPESEKATHYKEYLKFEQTDGNEPSRMQCLFERAITDCPLDAPLWLGYLEYLDDTLHIDTVSLPVCQRAVHNCPWYSLLWQHYMQCMERYNKSPLEIKGILEKALQGVVQNADEYRALWLEYCSYLCRHVEWDTDNQEKSVKELRDTVAYACENLAEFYGETGDPSCDLLRFQATFEAVKCRQMDQARKIWDDILNQGHRQSANSWLKYLQLESAYGDRKHLRKLYPRALQAVKDWPESIADEWLHFERTEGTLDSYKTAVIKCRTRLKAAAAEREKIAATVQEETQQKEEKRKGKKDFALKKKETSEYRSSKHDKPSSSPEIKKSTLKRPAPQDEREEKKTKIAPPPGYKPDSPKKPKLDNPEEDHGTVTQHDSSKDDRTVFLSNLDYSTSEEKIRELFSSVGTITELRLVKDFKGRSKGFCYLVFSSHKEVGEALKKDRITIEGRPMFVSRCDPDRHTRQSGLRYSVALEKSKLFVKGLPLTTTKDELMELFSQYGKVKDIRLVTYRNGHFKGLAYVDFSDEASAAHALIKVDGMTMGNKVVSVAISNPPDRRTSLFAENQNERNLPFVQSLGGGAKETGSRGRGRTQLSFLPRSVQVKTECGEGESDKDASGPSTNGAPKSKSNDEFRQLLLSKK